MTILTSDLVYGQLQSAAGEKAGPPGDVLTFLRLLIGKLSTRWAAYSHQPQQSQYRHSYATWEPQIAPRGDQSEGADSSKKCEARPIRPRPSFSTSVCSLWLLLQNNSKKCNLGISYILRYFFHSSRLLSRIILRIKSEIDLQETARSIFFASENSHFSCCMHRVLIVS